jgi:hypothetical protein
MPLRGVGTWRRPLFYEGYGEFLTSATLQEPLRWTACNPKAYLENSCPAVMRTWWTCSSSEVVNAQSKPPTNDHTSSQIIYINEIIDAIRTCFDLSCHFIGAPASPAFSTPWVGCLLALALGVLECPDVNCRKAFIHKTNGSNARRHIFFELERPCFENCLKSRPFSNLWTCRIWNFSGLTYRLALILSFPWRRAKCQSRGSASETCITNKRPLTSATHD